MSTRRSFLKKFGLGAASLGALPLASCTTSAANKPDFSLIHLTDSHVTRKRSGVQGYETVINAINDLPFTPKAVLMGGDMAFDGLYTDRDIFVDQIRAFKSVSDRLSCPWYPCIGNHDVLGLNARRKVPIDDPQLGATLIANELGMSNTYYSFDIEQWHIVVLDSIHQIETENGPSYEPRIGEDQLLWLRKDLGANHEKPTIVVSHYALFNHMGQINADFEMKAMNHLILQNNQEIRFILERHNVKAVLQGHTHMSENFEFNGIHYITSQAASAAWWGGNWLGFKPGFTVLHIKDDSLTWERMDVDWEHQLEPEDTTERERIEKRKAFEAEQARLAKEDIAL